MTNLIKARNKNGIAIKYFKFIKKNSINQTSIICI